MVILSRITNTPTASPEMAVCQCGTQITRGHISRYATANLLVVETLIRRPKAFAVVFSNRYVVNPRKATLTDTVKEGDAALVPMAKPPARHRRPRPRPRSRPGANHLIAKGKRVLVPKLHPDIPSPPNKGVLDYYWGSGSTRPKVASPSKPTTRAPRRKPDPKPQVEEVCIELAIPDEHLQQRSWSISTEERRFFPGLGGRCDSTPPSPLSWC